MTILVVMLAMGIEKVVVRMAVAHVTNTMAQNIGDFEKGENDGSTATLALVAGATRAWLSSRSEFSELP